MKKLTDRIIVTGLVRLAYPRLYNARPNKLAPEKPDEFSVTALFPKENTDYQPNAEDEIKEMKLFMKSVATAKWADKAGKVDYSLKDGDTEVNQDGDPRFPGYYYIRCNAPCRFKSGDEFRPNVFDGNMHIMTSGGKSGDWGKVAMDVFAYETPAKKGVTTRLKEVQFIFEDEPIGNVMAAGSGFEEEPKAHKMNAVTMVSDEPEYDPFSDN